MLVARAQLDLITELVARFERDDGLMRPVADYQSHYIAIIALLRSVGHVFEKVDCSDAGRREWSKQRWRTWTQEPVFGDFIEPARNALLKEFQGGLQLHSDAFGSVAVMADPSMPGGASRLAAFDAHQVRDLTGRPVLPQIHAAVAFWDRCLKEAETRFGETAGTRLVADSPAPAGGNAGGESRLAKSAPPWQAHDAANFDHDMTIRCAALLGEIASDRARRQGILADPRNLHRELFAPFAPPGHGEYAGAYRGTPGTTLADRRMSSESQLEPSVLYEFCLPGEVPGRMDALLKQVHAWLGDANADDYGKLIVLTYAFCWFGKIHPFLDGNGHVQRALFAAMATDFGCTLSPRFAIHPRPFDRLLAIALEIFTRAPAGKENEELGLVAEYLAFFLDGPFNAPRKHVGTATPYV